MAQIHVVAHVVTSERDRNGNCYHVATLHDTETGARTAISDSPAGNVSRFCLDLLGLKFGEFLVIESTISKAQFRALSRTFPAWQSDEQIAAEFMAKKELMRKAP